MAVEPEQRLAEALRARATGAGQQSGGRNAAVDVERAGMRVPIALLIAMVAGILLGTGLALVSLLAPGVLPGTA